MAAVTPSLAFVDHLSGLVERALLAFWALAFAGAVLSPQIRQRLEFNAFAGASCSLAISLGRFAVIFLISWRRRAAAALQRDPTALLRRASHLISKMITWCQHFLAIARGILFAAARLRPPTLATARVRLPTLATLDHLFDIAEGVLLVFGVVIFSGSLISTQVHHQLMAGALFDASCSLATESLEHLAVPVPVVTAIGALVACRRRVRYITLDDGKRHITLRCACRTATWHS